MGNRFTILHVDDEKGPLSTTKKAFERFAPYFTLTQYNNAIQALVENKHNKFDSIDAIITDINMPALNGPRFARAVRSMQDNMPIIYNTASETSEDRQQLQLEKNTAYTAKIDEHDDAKKNLQQLVEFMHFVYGKVRDEHITLNIGGQSPESTLWTDQYEVTAAQRVNEDAAEQARWLRTARILNNLPVHSLLRNNTPTTEFSEIYPHLNDDNPPHACDQPQIILITGPKGAGKDSLARNIHFALPYTHLVQRIHTRQPRPGEYAGHPIRFVQKEDILDPEAYASQTTRGTDIAAIPYEGITHALNKNKHAIIVAANMDAIRQLREKLPQRYPVPIHTLLVTAPYVQRKERTTFRGGAPTRDDSETFADLNPSESIKNRGTGKDHPYLPSTKTLKQLQDSTKQAVAYIRKL